MRLKTADSSTSLHRHMNTSSLSMSGSAPTPVPRSSGQSTSSLRPTKSASGRNAYLENNSSSFGFQRIGHARHEGRLLGSDEEFRLWTKYTVLLTLTGRTEYPEDGGPLPPCVHMDRLFDVRQARRTALSRCLSGIERWRRITTVIVVDKRATAISMSACPQRVSPAGTVRTDVSHPRRNSPIAEWSAHGTGTCSVSEEIATTEPTGLIGCPGVNVPDLDTRG